MNLTDKNKKIAIVGGGFSGISLLAMIEEYAKQGQWLNITIFDRSKTFGAGPAYQTEFDFHLLNVQAQEMSLFENQHNHFVDWVKNNLFHFDKTEISSSYLPRILYHQYLQDCLKTLNNSNKIQLELIPEEVIEIAESSRGYQLKTFNNNLFYFKKIVLALGNGSPVSFPFDLEANTKIINNPWDYKAPQMIKKDETVFIMGTGLSMIDTVLTLHHQQHVAKIIVLSRHGLLPLPHKSFNLASEKILFPKKLKQLFSYLRRKYRTLLPTEDWRSLIQMVREEISILWFNFSLWEKKQFLRHLYSYWKIHRHRVHPEIYDLLMKLKQNKQLEIIAGRLQEIKNQHILIKTRKKQNVVSYPFDWIINCLGPSLLINQKDPLIHSLQKGGLLLLDDLGIGFQINEKNALINQEGNPSNLFTLGAPSRTRHFDRNSVPTIRKQSSQLAKYLLTEM